MLMEQIKTDYEIIRKGQGVDANGKLVRDAVKYELMNTLIGDLTRAEKDKLRALTDVEVRTLIQSYLKNLRANKATFTKFKDDVNLAKTEAEMEQLLTYMPKQLNEQELLTLIQNFTQSQDLPKSPKSIGAVLKMLRSNYEFCYDPDLASTIVNTMFKP